MRPESGTHGTHGTRPDANGTRVLRLGAEQSPVQIRPPPIAQPGCAEYPALSPGYSRLVTRWETRYARSGELAIAYQVHGSGKS
jgi:hypothetical protein